jgi:arabinosaccharide transport system substrate-binding protein
MRFHLGRPLGAMIAIAVLSGAAAMVRPRAVHSDLTLWTFADTHRDAYLPLTGRFQNQSGRSVDIHLISPFALHTRLMSLFMSGASGEVLPDAVEIDLGSIGRYFRPPVGQVGFLPLNNYLENTGFREINSLDDAGQAGWHARLRGDGRIYRFDGARWLSDPSRARPDAWIDRILPSRLALWSKDGVVFGIPHDVHPTLLCYRADLFGQAGVAIESPKTWDDFQEKCLQFQQYWAARGYPRRHAVRSSDDDAVATACEFDRCTESRSPYRRAGR